MTASNWIGAKLRIVLALGLGAGMAIAQQATPTPAEAPPAPKKGDKAAAYYYYSLGHLYADLAQLYGGRGDHVTRAVDNFKLALKADPGASFVSEELSDLYIQSGRLREAISDAEEALKQDPDDLGARRILARVYTRMIGDPSRSGIDETNLKKAIEQYTKIVEKAPQDADVWLMLGRLYKVAQNSPESEKAYKKALEIEPENEDALTGLAMVYSGLGDTQKASELLRKVSQKNPSVRSLSALAETYEQMREFSLAAETLRKALELNPPNADDIKRALGQNLLYAEHYDEALKVYLGLVEAEPRDSQSFLRISQIYRQKGQFAKAWEAAGKAKAIEPGNLEVRYNEVNLLEAEGKASEAIQSLKELLTSTAKRSYSPPERSNRAVLVERLGIMYRNNEQYSEAVDTFRQVGDLDAELAPRAVAQIVDTYRIARDFAKAEQEAEAALKKYPGDRTVRAVRASLLADTGKAEAAAAEIKKLFDGKNDRETYISLAQVWEKAKRYDEMAKAIDEAEKLSDTKEEKENIYFMRGAMFERQKKHDLAEAQFRKVLEIDPDSSAALNYLGYMLADRNVRLQEALTMIQKALEREPNNAAYLDSLGWVYYRLGRLDEAEEYLRRSLAKASRDPTVHDHLGDVLAKKGQLRDAVAQWQRSIDHWNSSAPADLDTGEIAKVRSKLESARVRLAKESGKK